MAGRGGGEKYRWPFPALFWAAYVALGVLMFGLVGLVVAVVCSIAGFTAGLSIAVFQCMREADRGGQETRSSP